MSAKIAAMAALLLAGCAPLAPVTQPNETRLQGAALAKACEGRDGWSDAAPPARVFGNVYMVGTCGITVLLITTSQGHFLIDGATAEAAPGIAENIRKLGFDPGDVRYLLASHEHIDHAGGLAELKRLSGAKFVARAAAKDAMESGRPGPTDPQLGLLPPFDSVNVDLILEHGQSLRLGKQTMTMIATPGHTPGGTSWTWKSCDGANCRQIVYSDSLNAVSADNYRFTDHPRYVATLEGSIARIATTKPCDILISPHPGQSRMFERLAGQVPLIDAKGCATYAAAASERLQARLAKEKGN